MRSLIVLLVLLLPAISPAGDDVDYSAPYLVVEDGKLVTKYPAREHEANGIAATEPAAVRPPQSDSAAATPLQPWLLAGGVLVVLVGGLIVTTGRKA